jgi:protein TonB
VPIKTVTRGVQYLREPDPQYPDQAREQGEEGTVVLRVQVDVDGKPANVEVVRSSGSASLDEAGRKAARGALFKPYLEDGRPLSVYVIVPLRFQLDS